MQVLPCSHTPICRPDGTRVTGGKGKLGGGKRPCLVKIEAGLFVLLGTYMRYPGEGCIYVASCRFNKFGYLYIRSKKVTKMKF